MPHATRSDSLLLRTPKLLEIIGKGRTLATLYALKLCVEEVFSRQPRRRGLFSTHEAVQLNKSSSVENPYMLIRNLVLAVLVIGTSLTVNSGGSGLGRLSALE